METGTHVLGLIERFLSDIHLMSIQSGGPQEGSSGCQGLDQPPLCPRSLSKERCASVSLLSTRSRHGALYAPPLTELDVGVAGWAPLVRANPPGRRFAGREQPVIMRCYSPGSSPRRKPFCGFWGWGWRVTMPSCSCRALISTALSQIPQHRPMPRCQYCTAQKRACRAVPGFLYPPFLVGAVSLLLDGCPHC